MVTIRPRDFLISAEDLSLIFTSCEDVAPKEGKGLLFREGRWLKPAPLHSNLQKRRFTITRDDIAGKKPMGCFHSHVNGSARASVIDKHNIGALGLNLWLIISLKYRNFKVYHDLYGRAKKCRLLPHDDGYFIRL